MNKILTIGFISLLLSFANPKVIPHVGATPKSVLTANRLDRWLNYYHLRIESFNDPLPINKLKMRSRDYDFLADEDNLFKEFFVFSPDSLRFIDLDSYSIMLEKNEDGTLVSNGHESDIEIGLIDIETKKRNRILFCGKDCRPEEAFWGNKDFFYVVGFTKHRKKDYPTLWTFDLENNTSQEFRSKDTIDISSKNYIGNVRLKTVTFYK